MSECKPLPAGHGPHEEPAPVSRHTDCVSQPPLFSAHVVLGLHPVLPLPRCSAACWNSKQNISAVHHILAKVLTPDAFSTGVKV